MPTTLQFLVPNNEFSKALLDSHNFEIYIISDEHRNESHYARLNNPNNFFSPYYDADKLFVIKHKKCNIRVLEFPGNCSWLIVYRHELSELREIYNDIESLAKALNYSHIILSITLDNKAIYTPFLDDKNFKQFLVNKNRHSGNYVILYIAEIDYSKE